MVVMALPAAAMSPAGSYDEELYGRNKRQITVKPQFEVNAGFITGGKLETKNFGKIKTNLSRPSLEVVGGVRLGKFVFAGVGTGVQYAYGECSLIEFFADAPDSWGMVTIPIYANVRGYVPTRMILKPYVSVSIGGQVVATSNFSQEGYCKINGGIMMKFGAGFNISKFNFAMGMAAQNIEWIDDWGDTNFKSGNHAFYIEAGVTF